MKMSKPMKMMSEDAMDMQDNFDPIWVTDFDEVAAKDFSNALFRASKADPEAPIIVYINSPGGYLSALQTMMSAMDVVPNKIVTVAMGMAASCGCFLLAHGDIRMASPYATIMLHKISAGSFGHIEDIEADTEEHLRENQAIFKVFSTDIKKPVSKIEKDLKVKRDLYFSAETAKNYGIVDLVGIPRLQQIPVSSPQYGIEVVGEQPTTKKNKPKTKKKTKK